MLHKTSFIAFCIAIVVVVLGAYTRLVDAGLGCPDWPTCYGHLWVPDSASEIAKANQKFVDTPVDTAKTWPEQIHRIFASSLGLVILLMFFLSVRLRKQYRRWKITAALLLVLVAGTFVRIIVGDAFDFPLLAMAMGYFAWLAWQCKKEGSSTSPFKLLALLSGLVILQGWFGMWTVTLNLWPQVVTAHLLGGFTTLALIWLTVLRTGISRWQLTPAGAKKISTLIPFVWCVLVLVVAQIALGGWTTSNYAALACPDFPTCHGALWPQGDFAQGFNIFQHVGPNYLGGQLDNHARTAIHFSHRLGALLVFLGVGTLALRLWLMGSTLPAESSAAKLKRMAVILASVLIVQVALGITNVVGGLPLMVAVAHNAMGAALLLTLVGLLHRIYTAQVQ